MVAGGAAVAARVALGEGVLTVTHENLVLFEGETTGHLFVRVENTGDAPIAVGEGTLVISSDTDEALITEEYFRSTLGSPLLQPGEHAYIDRLVWDSALRDANITGHKFSLSPAKYTDEYLYLKAEAAFSAEGFIQGDNYVYVTFTNTTDAVFYGAIVTTALMDTQGNLVFVEGRELTTLGIHPGSTVTVKVLVDRDFRNYYEANAVQLATADAMVALVQE